MGGATEHWVAMGAQYLLYSKSYVQRSIQSHRPVHNVLTVGHSTRMNQTHPHLTTYVRICIVPSTVHAYMGPGHMLASNTVLKIMFGKRTIS